MLEITVQRIYDEEPETAGKRILVDRLWPRGITKERANLDLWLKEVAPSTALRGHFIRMRSTGRSSASAILPNSRRIRAHLRNCRNSPDRERSRCSMAQKARLTIMP